MKSTSVLSSVVFVAGVISVAWADGPCEYDLPTFGENFLFTVPGVGTVRTGVNLPLFGPTDVGDATTYSIMNMQNMQPCDCTGRPTNCSGDFTPTRR